MGVTNLLGNQDGDHVKNIAEFAAEAIYAANKIYIDEDDEELGTIQIRVGFHSGPVVSNVIGKSRQTQDSSVGIHFCYK